MFGLSATSSGLTELTAAVLFYSGKLSGILGAAGLIWGDEQPISKADLVLLCLTSLKIMP